MNRVKFRSPLPIQPRQAMRPVKIPFRKNQKPFFPALILSFSSFFAGCASDGSVMSFSEYQRHRTQSQQDSDMGGRTVLKYGPDGKPYLYTFPESKSPTKSKSELLGEYLLTPLDPYQKPRSPLDR